MTSIGASVNIAWVIDTSQPFTWLNPTEAAHHLGVDRSTLREWRETAGLPYHRTGTAGYLYEAAALEAWLAAHEAVSRPARVSRYAMGRAPAEAVPARAANEKARAEECEATISPSPVT